MELSVSAKLITGHPACFAHRPSIMDTFTGGHFSSADPASPSGIPLGQKQKEIIAWKEPVNVLLISHRIRFIITQVLISHVRQKKNKQSNIETWSYCKGVRYLCKKLTLTQPWHRINDVLIWFTTGLFLFHFCFSSVTNKFAAWPTCCVDQFVRSVNDPRLLIWFQPPPKLLHFSFFFPN